MIKVNGFLGSGISAGIKKKGGKDLALIYSEVPANAAGVFTTNIVKAAPVLVGSERIKSGRCQAVLINSGIANACTGEKGIRDAFLTSKLVASELGIDEKLVIPSSTGLIGGHLPVKKIKRAIPKLISNLREDGFKDTANAIMTTDKFPKYTSKKISIGKQLGTICAIGKGAGMIAPQMATMLCFILTDIDIHKIALKKSLKSSVEISFNRIIVDGDTSTNDTVLILSNGRLNNRTVRMGENNYKKIESALVEVTSEIAEMIVRDGEGATKVVKIIVKGAKSERAAKEIARIVGSSLLVKVAFYGEDPNWGRIIAAAGRSRVKFDPQNVDLYFGRYKVLKNGNDIMDENKVKNVLKKTEFSVTLDLKSGNYSSFVLSSDITLDYLKLNSLYRT